MTWYYHKDHVIHVCNYQLLGIPNDYIFFSLGKTIYLVNNGEKICHFVNTYNMETNTKPNR